ncbi:transposase [Candidatus Gottesmanbacteria bacterium]|nr:transposase [Candidatus Gottesmanbacteria bacterium]
MLVLKHLPKKVKWVLELSFPLINKLYPRETFIGGRIGYSKEEIFKWLLVKRVTNWDYRTIEDLSKISHQTFIRRNQQFEKRFIYQKFFQHLVKQAVKTGLIQGEKVAMDSSFVKTYSGKEEIGSLGFNGYKKAFGFKLHALIDTKSKFPLALIVTNGLVNDGQVAIPLLKKAKPFLKKSGYVLADKGYDDTTIVAWVMNFLKRKAGIPMRKKNKLARGKPHRYGNIFNWKLKAVGRTFKHSILKLRTEIERFFSSLKRKFFLGKELTRGIQSFTRNVYLSLISYALNQFYLVGMRSF